jgi:hypothetical protein
MTLTAVRGHASNANDNGYCVAADGSTVGVAGLKGTEVITPSSDVTPTDDVRPV